MHTSQALRSSHFEYRCTEASGRVAFSSFCADYHEQDRVGVVSPHLEDGILHTGYALLALTTAFYDVQRAGGGDFFIYPQHFAIIGQAPPTASRPRAETGRADQVGIATGAGRLDLTLDEAGIGGAWAWLDVWPASNWLTAPAAPTAMLKKVFDFHINRLFWPQDFTPESPGRSRQRRAEKARTVHCPTMPAEFSGRASNPSTTTTHPRRPSRSARPGRPLRLSKRASNACRQRCSERSAQDAQPERPLGHESYRQVDVDDFLKLIWRPVSLPEEFDFAALSQYERNTHHST